MDDKIVSLDSFAAARANITKNQMKSIEDEIKMMISDMDLTIEAMQEQNDAEEYEDYRLDAQALVYHCEDLIDKIYILKKYIPD